MLSAQQLRCLIYQTFAPSTKCMKVEYTAYFACECCSPRHKVILTLCRYSAQGKSTSFSRSTTSMSNWRRHLLTKHLGLWVEVCDRLKVKITADNAEGPVAAYRESKGQGSRQNSALPDGIDEVPGFSLEAFIDALVAFIVSNDQVGFSCVNQVAALIIIIVFYCC